MAQKHGKNFPKRGEVYWVDLEPIRGAETSKKRPGLIVSNDIGNEISNVVMIAPITSKALRIYPFEVGVVIQGKRGKIMLNQCRVIDKSRLQNRIDSVDMDTMDAVCEALKIVLALD